MRLTKTFNPTLTAALEALLPRLRNATEWALANTPPDDLLALPRTQGVQAVVTQTGSMPQGTRADGTAADGEVHPHRGIPCVDEPRQIRRAHVWAGGR